MVHSSRVPWRELGVSESKGKHPLWKVKQSSSQANKIHDRVLGLYHRLIKHVLDYSLGVGRYQE